MEIMKVFDKDHQYIDDASRDEVHRNGLWHETFHCWIVSKEVVYIQRRSVEKNDFPLQFDVTVAGHLESNESNWDGIREMKEELGIQVDQKQLDYYGVVTDCIHHGVSIDREFVHLFLYESTLHLPDLSLQKEEVDSLYFVDKASLQAFFRCEVHKIEVVHLENGTCTELSLSDFVPHETTYFEAVAKAFDSCE